MRNLFSRGPLPLLRELERTDLRLLQSYIDDDPVGCAFFQDRLDAAGHSGRTASNARFYGLFVEAHPGRLRRGESAPDGPGPEMAGVVFAGVNLVPHGAWAEIPAAAGQLVDRMYDERCHQPASIYGQSRAVMAIWQEFSRRGIRSHEIRAHQPFLTLTRERFEEYRPYTAGELPPLRRSALDDFPLLYPASVAMFTEEVGYSPVEPSSRSGMDYSPEAGAYQARVRQLIEQGRSYCHISDGQVVFKAEFSAVSPVTASVQGVWLNPEFRGRGLSSAYMRALAAAGLEHSESVSLYANGYNYAALGAYAKAGFEQTGTYATVLL